MINSLVSVIIPVYNREQLVGASLQSVFDQIYRPIECIIIDDGSTDASIKVVKQKQIACKKDKTFEIIIVEQDNSGAPAARNKGLEVAQGDYIQFLDSDDILYRNKLKSQVEYLHQNPHVDGVYGDWHEGTTIEFKHVRGEKWEDTITQFYGGRSILNFSFLLRRTMISKIGLWDTKLKRSQEVDYFLRGAIAKGHFEYLPMVTGLWREHDGDRVITGNGAIHVLAFHDKWIQEFQKLGIFTPERKKMAGYYLFWLALELKEKEIDIAIHYLQKAHRIYPKIPEFNTPKMKLLRRVFGDKISLRLWLQKANKQQKANA